jgi:hypothetical protein
LKTRDVIVAVLTVLVLVGSILGTACGTGSEPQDREFDLRIEDGKINLDPPVIKGDQGDTVTFNVQSDTPGDLHLHGYSLVEDVGPETAGRMSFVADATGSFVMKLHLFEEEGEHEESEEGEGGEETEITLATLEVRPR